MTGRQIIGRTLLMSVLLGLGVLSAQANIIFSEDSKTQNTDQDQVVEVQGSESPPQGAVSAAHVCLVQEMNQKFIEAMRQCEHQTQEALETCDSKRIDALVVVQKSIAVSNGLSNSAELTNQGRTMLEEKKKSCDRIARACYTTCTEVRNMALKGKCNTSGFEGSMTSCERGEAYARWIQMAGAVATATRFEDAAEDEIGYPAKAKTPVVQRDQVSPIHGGVRPASTGETFRSWQANPAATSSAREWAENSRESKPKPRSPGASFPPLAKVKRPSALSYSQLRRLSPIQLDRLENQRRHLIEKYQSRLVRQQAQVDRLIQDEKLFHRQSYWHLRNSGKVNQAAEEFPKLHQAYMMKQKYHLLMAKDPGYIRAHEELYLITRVRYQGQVIATGGNRVPARDPNQMCVCAMSDTLELCRLRLRKNQCL
ncbi:MAG: hypothetical protein H6624_06090 [Bdellovibrionaceae bacterium]|nr:hypothetical protein [Bdellovibrionales bacterium]MCB9083893.1 hypothetical protein [Pseudobdellovibrionaceae bacterium]